MVHTFPHLDKIWSTYAQVRPEVQDFPFFIHPQQIVARRTKSSQENRYVVENVGIVSCTRSGQNGVRAKLVRCSIDLSNLICSRHKWYNSKPGSAATRNMSMSIAIVFLHLPMYTSYFTIQKLDCYPALHSLYC